MKDRRKIRIRKKARRAAEYIVTLSLALFSSYLIVQGRW